MSGSTPKCCISKTYRLRLTEKSEIFFRPISGKIYSLRWSMHIGGEFSFLVPYCIFFSGFFSHYCTGISTMNQLSGAIHQCSLLSRTRFCCRSILRQQSVLEIMLSQAIAILEYLFSFFRSDPVPTTSIIFTVIF